MYIPFSIKLWRRGAKTRPIFTIVVSLKKTRHRGLIIDKLGHYDPCKRKRRISINVQKLAFWLNRGVKIKKSVFPLLAKLATEII